MKELTEQEGERCARVCGFMSEVDAIKTGIMGPKGDASEYYSDLWYEIVEEREQKRLVSHDGLSLDPHFWFGRLWDKLCGLAKERWSKEAHVYVQLDAQNYNEPFQAGAEVCLSGKPEDRFDSESDHPCLALCEAIEKLVEK